MRENYKRTFATKYKKNPRTTTNNNYYQKLVTFGSCMKNSSTENNDYLQAKHINSHVLNEFNMNGNSKSNRTYRIEIFPSLQMTYFNRGFSKNSYFNKTCALSVIFAFTFGLLLGISIPFKYLETKDNEIMQLDSVNNSAITLHRQFNVYNDDKKELPYIAIMSADDDKKIFDSFKRIYETVNIQKNISQVSFIRDLDKSKGYDFINDSRKIKIKTLVQTEEVAVRYEYENALKDEHILSKEIFWGTKIEKLLPKGFDTQKNEDWIKYVATGSVIKLETGCGRMQNRMATFSDGRRACVRYRQNLDQIQGEMFSFYLAQMLHIPNLPPSTVALVNTTNPLWKSVVAEIESAQWNSNRPVVITQYIPELEPALIPSEFKPNERHLNKFDIQEISKTIHGDLSKFVELAQWSDLIIFDYLTANLDRIVNNLYNYQWNVNIMDAPAHNLARELNTDLLVFLDNESGLLHGYRLLQKYEPFHMALLQGLCVFRETTASAVRGLHASDGAGDSLNKVYGGRADAALLDALPPLPTRNSRILQERLASLVLHIDACQRRFDNH